MSVPVRILFVEDTRDDVDLVLHELRRGGFTPDHWVVETEEAMRKALAEERWDLVIADHAMPHFDAPGALAVLQQSGQDLPFIVVSGHIGEEQAVACMKAGASDYLTKDNLVRLAPAVERELREAAQRQQRRQALAALSTSEERCRLLVENSADMITLLDAQGRITFASPSVTRVLGFQPAEVLGRRPRDFVHEDDAKVLASALGEVLAHGSTPLFTGLRFRHRDGTWRIVEGSAARIVEPDGTVGLVATGRDITERVQLEAQLHQAQKMEAVGRLAGGVAHDFNNLLTVILGYSNLLLEQLDENRVLYQEVAEIKRAADRAATLTQQLLAFSRKQVLSLRPVDLNQVLGAQADMLRRLIGEDVELDDEARGRPRPDPGGPRPDRAGGHEPGGERARRHAAGRPALDRDRERGSGRRLRAPARRAARAVRHARRDRHRGRAWTRPPRPGSSSPSSRPRSRARGRGSGSPASTRSCASAGATSSSTASRDAGAASRSTCRGSRRRRERGRRSWPRTRSGATRPSCSSRTSRW